MKKQICRRKFYYSVLAIFSLFAVCNTELYADYLSSDLNEGDSIVSDTLAAELPDEEVLTPDINEGDSIVPDTTVIESLEKTITFHQGMLNDGSVETKVVTKDSYHALTNMGISRPGYMLGGWHTQMMPVITSVGYENYILRAPKFYAIGDSFQVESDLTLYAVWFIDHNNDRRPDYIGSIIKPRPTKAFMDKIIPKDDELSLRSSLIAPWNNNYDVLSVYDSVYYVGCTYNRDPDNKMGESLITFESKYCFDESGTKNIKAGKDLIFVVEYEGVLNDSCMVGGPNQKPLTKIKLKQGTSVDSLFQKNPFKFTSIKKDGLGILRMYFTDPSRNDSTPLKSAWVLDPGIWTSAKAFMDPQTGIPSDTITLKFYVYNKPVFESEVIGQSLDSEGRLRMKHVNGTPLKYMMRSIEGYRWRRADEPLSKGEQDEVWSGATIYLRELDPTIGYQTFEKAYYLSSDFDTVGRTPIFHQFKKEYANKYNQSYYNSLNSQGRDSIDNANRLINPYMSRQDFYDIFIFFNPGATHEEAYNFALEACLDTYGSTVVALGNPAYPGSPAVLQIGDSLALANWHIMGQRLADSIPVPDPCHTMFSLTFNVDIPPAIMREIEIKTISGVTATPGAGIHLVNSRENFTFTMAFADGAPKKVMVQYMTSNISEELHGTSVGNGVYSYVVNQVQEPCVITVLPVPASNEVVTGGRVWAHDNALYIDAEKPVRANVYSINGKLLKQLDLPAGISTEQLESGVYIVEIDGAHHKVVVK